MPRVVARAFSVSVDGYGAGPRQDLQNPLGVGGVALPQWFFPTRTFRETHGQEGGTTDADDRWARRSFENLGAWILGRNMFGPVRGPWEGSDWSGWWGPNPPYHVPVFVLTHHARDPLPMEGGTTFHFVTGGIHEALERARSAAAGRDVRIGGGVATLRQFLHAGLMDELHVAISPVALGAGEHLWTGIDLNALGLEAVRHEATAGALHVLFERR